MLLLSLGCGGGDGSGGQGRDLAPGATMDQGVSTAPNQDGAGAAASPTDFGNSNTGPSSAGTTAGMEDLVPVATGSLDANAVLNGSCASSTVETELLPTNVLFVLDRSASMLCNPPPTTDSRDCETTPERAVASEASKWEITTDALLNAVSALPPTATVGLSYFSKDDRCGVNSEPSVALAANGATQSSAFASSLATVTPGGGTPLVGATILAYHHLHEAALAGDITGNTFVVLITDGAQSEVCANPPQCENAASCVDLLVSQEVPKAAGPGVGIRTFVIGVPGSELSRVELSQIAVRGGTAAEGCDPQQGKCHFDMTSVPDLAQALAQALMQITTRAVTCEFDVPRPTSGELDLGLLNVVYSPGDGSDPSLVYQDTRAPCDSGANGWQFTADNSKIRLCGPSCDTIRADDGANVEVVIGCPVQAPD